MLQVAERLCGVNMLRYIFLKNIYNILVNLILLKVTNNPENDGCINAVLLVNN